MSLRRIFDVIAPNNPLLEARVFRDSETQEFRVRIYKAGRLYEPADYFTNDLEDAKATARSMVGVVKRGNNPAPRGSARITNRQVRSFVQRMEPFNANNVYGRRLRDGSFGVFSYGEHWPMFVNVAGTWYENAGRYSMTTSKHRGQAHPGVETVPMYPDQIRRLVGEHNPIGTRVGRCVRKVARKGSRYNAYAVCQKATRQSYASGRRLNPVQTRAGFVNYLRRTLIPDTRESGLHETAHDLAVAASIIETGRLPPRSKFVSVDHFKWFLRNRLIPDLKESGRSEYAKDFATALRLMARINPARRGSVKAGRYRVVAIKGRTTYYLAASDLIDTNRGNSRAFDSKPHAAKLAGQYARRFPAYRWGVEAA